MTYTAILQKKSTGNSLPRISIFEYLYVLILIFYTGHANKFVVSTSILDNPVWFTFLIILSGIIAMKWSIVFNKQFYLLIFCYIIYFAAISIKYIEIRPTFFLNNVLLFFIAYATIKSLKDNLFRIYELLMYFMAIVGIAMWIVQIILGGDALYNIIEKIPSIDEFSFVSGQGLNIFFYSVQPTTMSLQYDFLPPRNCGFAWEPGGFAVLLCLALYINLFFFPADRKNNIRFWILFAALVSSQSTTGYAIFIVMILFYYFNKKQKLVVLFWPVIIAILVFIFSLPFMSDKIVSLVDETSQIDVIVEGSIGRETSTNPQRFSSFMIALRDFIENPILGLGGKSEESWTYKIGANVSTITGIGNLLAQYGLIGFLFFIINLFKTSSFYSKNFKYRGKILFFLIMLFISISYGIVLLPLMMSFWMFQFFTPRSINEDAASTTDNSYSRSPDAHNSPSPKVNHTFLNRQSE